MNEKEYKEKLKVYINGYEKLLNEVNYLNDIIDEKDRQLEIANESIHDSIKVINDNIEITTNLKRQLENYSMEINIMFNNIKVKVNSMLEAEEYNIGEIRDLQEEINKKEEELKALNKKYE